MSFDKPTRNALAKMVGECRRLLTDDMVETCAFVLGRQQERSRGIFLRLVNIGTAEKGHVLLEILSDPFNSRCYIVDQELFRLLPGSPFAYWVSPNLFQLLASGARLGENWDIVPGLTTRDNVRFCRSPVEVPRKLIGKQWSWFAKGGDFSPYYFDTELVLNYDDNGSELKAWIRSLGESVTTFIANQRHYFRAGFTFPRVTDKGFNVRVLREGHIFAEKGISIFPKSGGRLDLKVLAYLNSGLAQELLLLMAPSRSWEKAFVASLPALPATGMFLLPSAECIVGKLELMLTRDVTSNLFVSVPLSASLASGFGELVESQEKAKAAIDMRSRESSTGVRELFDCPVEEDENFRPDPRESAFNFRTLDEYTRYSLDYVSGAAFGRWDIRFGTGEKPVPELPDTFASLPVCPPGMLQNEHGLPLTQDDGRRFQATGQWDYPIDIPWDGILVDDPGVDRTQPHTDDILRRVRHVLTVIWKARAEAIEQEACEILRLKDLREYFRKPALFFADHLKRHSKSRRQAPIYWPLSTASGSYTLWIYYHRLNDDTLFTALNKYVKPKIDEVDRRLRQVESELPNSTGRDASKLRDVFEDTKAFLEELCEFRDELQRVAALPYKPNLNDGVLITASPLWKLGRLPKWRKDLEECWKKLAAGDYDWAHLAYSIWPERVCEVCKRDRSIAIAHGLEELCEVAVKPAKKKRSRKQGEEANEAVLGDAEPAS